jgi:hypothetical protein
MRNEVATCSYATYEKVKTKAISVIGLGGP